MSGATAGEAFFVLRIDPNEAVNTSYTLWNAGSSNTLYPHSSGHIVDGFGSTQSYEGAAPIVPLTSAHIYEVSAQNGSWSNSLNGAPYLAQSTNAVAFNSNPSLGYSGNLRYGNAFQGDIAEILVFDHVLSSAERSVVQSYLSQRYAIASYDTNGLPVNWELAYFGTTGLNAQSAPNGNGQTLASYASKNANPIDYYDGRAFALNASSGTSNPDTNIVYAYDASGRIISASYPNGTYLSFVHDASSNLSSATSSAGAIVAWRIANGLPADGTGNGADTAILTADGIPNLAKYAFGLDPRATATGSYPTISLTMLNGNSYLTLTYVQPEPAPLDLNYVVQVSGDRVTWISGPSAAVTLSTTVANGFATVVVRDAVPINSMTSFGRYIRLSIDRRSQP